MAPKAKPVRGRNKTELLPFNERGGKLMTVAEAAAFLGVIPRQIRRMLDRNELTRIKVGKLVRVHIDDLNAYIAQQRGERA